MKLKFEQRNSESGGISGEGIDWYWTGRDLEGPEEPIEEICEAVFDVVKGRFGDVGDDWVYDLSVKADVVWVEGQPTVASNVQIFFEFSIQDLDETTHTNLCEEIAESFGLDAEDIETPALFKLGENTVKVGAETVLVIVEKDCR